MTKGRGFQDGVVFGERAFTDTLGLIEAKSSQARRLCHRDHVTQTFYLLLAALCHTILLTAGA